MPIDELVTTVAGELAHFVTRTAYDDIPPKAIDYAAMLVASTLASAAMGSTLKSSDIVHSMLVQRGGEPEASVWFSRGVKLPVTSAARINALMSDAAASDDSDLRNITHPGTTLVAASLAVAQKTSAHGRDVLTAIALGYEVAGRINTGVVPGIIWEKGFHGCMVVVFGGAVAAGLLLGLDEDQMTHAIALAATSVAGLLAAANTSTAREHQAGLAAMLGVEAAQLAKLGYTGEASILEHPRGFFWAYGQDAHASGRVAQVTRGLGESWKILTDMAIKLVPGGHPYHAIAEAAANAAGMADVPPSDIAAIIFSRPDAHQAQGPRRPTGLIGIAHSPYYFAAAGVADREFTWAHASPDKIMDPTIRQLLSLVETGEAPTEDLDRYRQGATVTVKTQDGRSFTNTVFAPRGSAANGIEWADVDLKFRTLCALAATPPSNIDKCVLALHHFRDMKDIRELIELID